MIHYTHFLTLIEVLTMSVAQLSADMVNVVMRLQAE